MHFAPSTIKLLPCQLGTTGTTAPSIPTAPGSAATPRGWRSRHHREHVDGDYKSPPPPGSGESLHSYSKHLMKRDPVKIEDVDLREFVLVAAIERLIERNIEVRIGCFDGIHLHLLI